MKKTQPLVAEYLTDGPLKGMVKCRLPERLTFAHWLPNGDSHLFDVIVIYAKGKKSIAYCPDHKEYIDVSV